MAEADTMRARLAKLPLILNRFRQTVLRQRVQGRLTDDWREARALIDGALSSTFVGIAMTGGTMKQLFCGLAMDHSASICRWAGPGVPTPSCHARASFFTYGVVKLVGFPVPDGIPRYAPVMYGRYSSR